MNSQMIGIKSQVNKDYLIQFSIKFRKMLLPCRNSSNQMVNMIKNFCYNKKIHFTQNATLMAPYIKQEIVYNKYRANNPTFYFTQSFYIFHIFQ